MHYTIRFTIEAEVDLDFLYSSDRKLFARILSKIEILEKSPREGKPLVGNHAGEFSLRIGDYRVVYQIDTSDNIIHILTIKHRKHVY
jgi:mRNA interferase RelE/StbE